MLTAGVRSFEEPRRGRGAEFPVALLVIVGLTVGAALAAWWSVTRASASTALAAPGSQADRPSGSDWTGVGWEVPADRPWLGAVVRVTASRCGQVVWGSGVVVDGVVLTDRHVVEGASEIRLTLASGRVATASAMSQSPVVDLATVVAPGLGSGLRLAGGRNDESGYDLAGFPGGGAFQVRRVSVEGTQRGWGYPDPERPIRLAATVVPGESGSAVIDSSGDVAALVYAQSKDSGAGLAVAADELGTRIDTMSPVPLSHC